MIQTIKSFTTDYLSRHRNKCDRVLHIVGVPLVFFGVFQVFAGAQKSGFFNIIIGYLLQWIGHTYFEKNEVGEWILIKKIIKKLKKDI